MKLNRLLRHFLLETPKIQGNFKPDDNLPYFEESLTPNEARMIRAFLEWITEKGLTYGHGNINQRWDQFHASRKEAQ